MKHLFFVFVLIQCWFVGFAQNDKPDDGNCYAKSLIAPQHKKYEIEVAVPIGDMPADAVIDTFELTLHPASTREVIKGEDEYGQEIVCLEEVPPVVVTIYEVDTTTTDQYDFEYYKITEYSEEKSRVEWVEIPCKRFIDFNFVKDLKAVLMEKGFLESDKWPEAKQIDSATKGALVKYQEKHGLPIGNLDRATLEHLGVVVWGW